MTKIIHPTDYLYHPPRKKCFGQKTRHIYQNGGNHVISSMITANTKPAILWIMLVMLGLSTCHAQDLVIGTVFDPATGQGIPQASISLMRMDDSTLVRETLCNDEGRFQIKNTPFVAYLQITQEGYDTLYVKIPSTRDQGPTGLGKLEMGRLALAQAMPQPKSNCTTRFKQWWHNLFHHK